MLVTIASREDPDQTASEEARLIWICTVCLGLFGRQLVFEISVVCFDSLHPSQ